MDNLYKLKDLLDINKKEIIRTDNVVVSNLEKSTRLKLKFLVKKSDKKENSIKTRYIIKGIKVNNDLT